MKKLLYLLLVVTMGIGAFFSFRAPAEQKESPPDQVEYIVKQYSNNGQTPIKRTSPRVTPRAYESDQGAIFAQLPSDTGDEVIVIEPAPSGGLIPWITWAYRNLQAFAGILMLLILAIEPIIRWTPTEKDNNILRIIQSWLDVLIPNQKKGGGTFAAFKDPKDAPPIAFVPPTVKKE